MADIVITAANVAPGASAIIIKDYKAGAAVTAGQAVYLDTSTTPATWKLIDSNAAVTGNEIATSKGIAVNGAASGQLLAVDVADTDLTVGGTLTNGSTVYTSTTAGGVTHDVPTTGAYPTALGVAKSATKMVLHPVSSGAII
jgi:hypothetical protein